MGTSVAVNVDERYQDTPGLSYMAIDQYHREIVWGEHLSDEEVEKLLGRVARAQREPSNAHYAFLAKNARDCLVERFQGLVLRIARRWVFIFESMELLDLVNEGSFGLMRAIDQYSQVPQFHGYFSHFASACIRTALWDARCNSDGFVRIPKKVHSLHSKMKKVARQFEMEHGESPSVAQLASLVGVSEDRVFEIWSVFSREHPVCLSAFVDEENEYGEDRHSFVALFQSFVCDENERQLERRETIQHVLQQVLTEQQREVLNVRYGLNGEVAAQTENETANVLGITSATVNHVHQRVKPLLRDALKPLVSSEGDIKMLRSQYQAYYSMKEVASLLGVSSTTVRNYARQGRLSPYSSVRFGGRLHRIAFLREDVDAFTTSAAIPPIVA